MLNSALARADLAAVMRGHVVDRECPVAFGLTPPNGSGGLFVITDRSGFVLARVRERAQAVDILRSHLSAFCQPPAGTIRVGMRCLVSEHGHGAIVGFPLLWAPPAIERRLEREGWRMVDRLIVDIDASGVVAPVAHPSVDATAPGHLGLPSAPVRLTHVLRPDSIAPASEPGVFIAERVLGTQLSPEAGLAAIERLNQQLIDVPVEAADSTAVYRMLSLTA